tara:strand:- start:82 stop:363 length:282 start_codon:yes stop_codon:yes gene_type:complete
MPRDKGGFGRTGKKHFKVAKFNNRRRLKDLGQPTSLMLTGQAAAAPLNDASATVEPSAGVPEHAFYIIASKPQITGVLLIGAGSCMRPDCTHM